MTKYIELKSPSRKFRQRSRMRANHDAPPIVLMIIFRIVFYIPLSSPFFVTPCVGEPIIFSVNDPVEPGETTTVFGDGLGDIKNIIINRIANDAQAVDRIVESQVVIPIQPNNESVKFTVPENFGPGVYRFELIGGNGGAGGYLNPPTIYWFQGDLGTVASTGGWIRVLGRNVVRSPDAVLMLLPENNASAAITLHPGAASLWDANFALPIDIPAGTYRLMLWNGHGGGRAMIGAGTISILRHAADRWPLIDVFEFGAKGDGVSDDLSAIRAAMSEAEKNGGGTVYFPRGRYFLSGELDVPPYVTLKGESRNLVSLNWPQFEKAPAALINGFRDFSVKDLSIFTANYMSVISGGFDIANLHGGMVPKNIEIDNILVRASAYRGHVTVRQALERASEGTKSPIIINAPVTIQLTGNNIKVLHSDIYGSGSAFLLRRAEGAYIAHNDFYNGRGWYSITGANGIVFEDNRITGADIQSAGGGVNTFYVTSSQNVLLSNNRFSLLHGWDREAMTSDAAGGYYFGRIISFGGTKLSLTGPPLKCGEGAKSWSGAGVFIVAGRGTGQYAQVVGCEGEAVTLDRTFKVSPEPSSIVAIVSMQQNYLVIGNSFSDTGAAVQFYGTSLNHVVAENTSERTAGFLDKGIFYGHFQPSWYNQFLRNRIIEGNLYDPGGGNIKPGIGRIAVSGVVTDDKMPPLSRGIVVRGNHLENNAEIQAYGGNVGDTPGLVDLIVESNSVARADHGIVIGRGIQGSVVRNNRLIEIGKRVKGLKLDAHKSFAQ